jgi:activator of HSP90 ATPase
VTFPADPHEVYESLMGSRTHRRFTGSPARISRRVGGRFSAYDGGLTGTNLELVPDRRIVQAWKCTMEGWPEDHYSTATFSLRSSPGGTLLSFVQTGVPRVCREAIAQGWRDHYWKPMKEMLQALGREGRGKGVR